MLKMDNKRNMAVLNPEYCCEFEIVRCLSFCFSIVMLVKFGRNLDYPDLLIVARSIGQTGQEFPMGVPSHIGI